MVNKRCELTKSQCYALFLILTTQQDDHEEGKLKVGVSQHEAKKFSCDRHMVSQFWQEMVVQVDAYNFTFQEATEQGPDFTQQL